MGVASRTIESYNIVRIEKMQTALSTVCLAPEYAVTGVIDVKRLPFCPSCYKMISGSIHALRVPEVLCVLVMATSNVRASCSKALARC